MGHCVAVAAAVVVAITIIKIQNTSQLPHIRTRSDSMRERPLAGCRFTFAKPFKIRALYTATRIALYARPVVIQSRTQRSKLRQNIDHALCTTTLPDRDLYTHVVASSDINASCRTHTLFCMPRRAVPYF